VRLIESAPLPVKSSGLKPAVTIAPGRADKYADKEDSSIYSLAEADSFGGKRRKGSARRRPMSKALN
jgi:hypothetical protein